MPAKGLFKEITALFESKQRQLYVAALAITRERTSAEDAVHDALMAVASLATRPDNCEAYLFRTVRNKALHNNKQNNRFDHNVDPSDLLNVVNCSEDQKILASQVVNFLSMLGENPRQVIIMKLFADLTFNEIAEIMVSSPNTVASWYRRGLNDLKEQFNELRV